MPINTTLYSIMDLMIVLLKLFVILGGICVSGMVLLLLSDSWRESFIESPMAGWQMDEKTLLYNQGE